MPRLILLRHGQSVWNRDARFTGWTDVDLCDNGLTEAKHAAALLKAHDIKFDQCFTSYLKRSIDTLEIVLEGLGLSWLPVRRSWRLNERHYGALQGLNKAETAAKYGDEQVHIWRRSYAIPPPELELGDERHPSHDARYASIENLPATESLATTLERVLPCWNDSIVPELKSGKNVLIAAHGNSLRALVKMLDDISEDEITGFNIPTGVPLAYQLDDNLKPLSREFLGDADAIAAAAAAVANQASVD